MADVFSIVKYSAFLRKATRYNPTRGGMKYNLLVSKVLGGISIDEY